MAIGGSVRLFGAVAGAVFLLNAGLAFTALGQLRVGGPVYNTVSSGKDLIADILPPPEYVIEAYLEATLARDDPAFQPQRRSKLQQLHHDFDDRRAYWAGADLPALLRVDLGAATSAATPFWTAIEANLLPALERGDRVAAQEAYRTTQAAYAVHRAAIDHLVEGRQRVQ